MPLRLPLLLIAIMLLRLRYHACRSFFDMFFHAVSHIDADTLLLC